jgi:hypothetical protein
MLKKACQKNDASLAKECLLLWGEKYFNENIITLTTLASKYEGTLKQELINLDKLIYKGLSHEWSGEKLLLHIKELKSTKRKYNYIKKDHLPPLNLG